MRKIYLHKRFDSFIYRKWKDEKISISQLSKAYKMNLANLDYMLRLIDMHGLSV